VRIVRLRHLATVLNSNVDKVIDESEIPVRLCNYVDVYKNDFIDATLEFSAGSATKAEIERFGLRVGDVIITKDSEDRLDIGVPAYVRETADDLVCGYHLSLIRAKANVMRGDFLFWALQSKHAKDSFSNAAYGITRYGLTLGGIKSLAIHCPDLATQKTIADFLDRETVRIDQLIEKKQRLMEVLAEGLAALLEESTTPGEKIFDEMIPFRWVCRITEGQVDPTEPRWVSKPLIAPNHIQSGTGRLLRIETAEEQGAISGKYAYPSGTVLYSKIRPALAKACIAPHAGMCSADMYPILPDGRLLPEFLLMQLLSRKFTDWATLESMRVAMPKINRETLGNYRLWVPDRETQTRLAARYQAAKATRESVSDKVSASISRLREFRAALITAAVGGQIDVSAWVKRDETDRRLEKIEEDMTTLRAARAMATPA